jgi:hypothetical protein
MCGIGFQPMMGKGRRQDADATFQVFFELAWSQSA